MPKPKLTAPAASSSRFWLRLVMLAIAVVLLVRSQQQRQPQPEADPKPPEATAPREPQAPIVKPPTIKSPESQPADADLPVEPSTEHAPAEAPTKPAVKPARNAVGWNVGGGKLQVQGTVVSPVVVEDQAGKVRARGEVDLAETLARIDAGRQLDRFQNDGSTFGNFEGHLPKQPRGHYREWVHPTPGIGGPGPQRVVTGEDGEAWYTPDHYKSFIRVR